MVTLMLGSLCEVPRRLSEGGTSVWKLFSHTTCSLWLSVLISDNREQFFLNVLPFLAWQNGGIINVRNMELPLSVDYAKM